MINSKLAKYQFAAIIPAFNESADIDRVVRAVLPYARVIVVNDGSTDQTAQLAMNAGAHVINLNANMGYDKALETGLFHAIELGFDFAITLDGDGQHTAATLELFKMKLEEGADLVIGMRDRYQRYSEVIFSLVGHFLWGIKDPLCGMKGYKLSLLKKLGYFDSYKSIGTEFTIRSVRSRYRIEQIPIPTHQRVGQSRFGSGLLANLRIGRALVIGILIARNIS